jgi:hypothetical protein
VPVVVFVPFRTIVPVVVGVSRSRRRACFHFQSTHLELLGSVHAPTARAIERSIGTSSPWSHMRHEGKRKLKGHTPCRRCRTERFPARRLTKVRSTAAWGMVMLGLLGGNGTARHGTAQHGPAPVQVVVEVVVVVVVVLHEKPAACRRRPRASAAPSTSCERSARSLHTVG